MINPHRLHRKVSPSPLSELIIKTIEYCDEDLHENLYENIILTGWNAYTPDLANILKKTIKKCRQNQSIHIFSPLIEYYN
jgi:actin-related protein